MKNDNYDVYDVVTGEKLEFHIMPFKEDLEEVIIREEDLDLILDILDIKKAPVK